MSNSQDLSDHVGIYEGKPCRNRAADVKLVKQRLNAHGKRFNLPKPLDIENPACGERTIQAIKDFQRLVMKKAAPHGRVSPIAAGGTTLKALLKAPVVKKKWSIAPAASAALSQATAKWPKRSRASDGTLGDSAHAKRKSDHNPAADGLVHAFDLTHDPTNGVDCEKLSALLVSRQDSRVKYIIWNKQIINSRDWKWRAYSGKNGHTKHMHVSILNTDRAENDTSAWWDEPAKAKAPATPPAKGKPVAI